MGFENRYGWMDNRKSKLFNPRELHADISGTNAVYNTFIITSRNAYYAVTII